MFKRVQREFVELLNPIALGKAKIAYNFGLSECSRVKGIGTSMFFLLFYKKRTTLLLPVRFLG